MSGTRRGSHTTTRLTVHIVWVTKYRYKILKGDLQNRVRELVIQDCKTLEIKILKGVVSKDHIHIHIEYAPKLSISSIVKQLKGRSSRILQKEFPSLKKRYWGRHLWATGYGAFSTGNITEEMVQEYLEHHRQKSDKNDDNFIIE